MPATKKQQGSGGSALKRLRKSLTAAGVVGQQAKASRSKKNRKRGLPTEVGKNSTSDKLSVIRDEFNPFEIKTERTKFDVLNRKVKGTGGKPALNKQVGEENRKKTLLMEMRNKGHVGGIVDKRFGENNPQLTPEERMLERFTKEKQKNARANMFNLDDDDEGMGLTHYGQSLAEMDDFDDTGLRLSDDEDGRGGQLDRNIVSQMHFGGFDDDKNKTDENEDNDRPKSRAEVMKEIIMKSKLYKQERQAAKEEDETMREDLDEDFKDIQALLNTQSTKRKPLVSQSALFTRNEAENPKEEQEEEEEEKTNKYEDYDMMVHELTRDKRAMASDRTKTEEEIALEEKEKLEKAERARKRRMEGLESGSEDEDNKRSGRGRKRQKKGANAPQGDDLEDDYLEDLEDEASKLGQGLTLEDIQNGAFDEDDEDEEDSEIDEEDEDEEEGSDEDDDEDDDDEEEEEENYSDLEEDDIPEFGDDDDDMNEFGTSGIMKKTSKSKGKQSSKTAQQNGTKVEIPYTFECPATHEEFLEIMNGLDVDDAPTVVKRIRVLYHPKLGADNKEKLTTFLGVLVDHLGYIASTVTPLPQKTLESLITHTFEISKQLPTAAGNVFVAKLKEMHGTMGQKMNQRQGSAFPDIEDITLLRCLGKVFPTSDLTHPVVTPATLYMSQALALCRIQSEIDIGRGLFLCLLFHEYQTFAKRFVPEVLNFLQQALIILSPEDLFDDEEKIPGAFPISNNNNASLHIKDIVSEDTKEIPSITLEQLGIESVDEDESNILRLSLLQGVLRLLAQYLQLYASTPALVEVFEPLSNLITQMLTVSWHKDIEELLNKSQDRLKKQIKFCKDKRIKTPLRMQSHRPIPIAQHLPKFEQGYSYDRHYDPDRERSEYNKLQSQIKKEKKGAIRELRKDNMFIAREKVKERKQKDAEYDKMIKGVMTILETDQAEKKRQEREKRR